MADSLKTATEDDPVWLYIYKPSNRSMKVYRCWPYVGYREDGDGMVRVEYKAYSDISKKLTTMVPAEERLANEKLSRGLTAWATERDDGAVERYFADKRIKRIQEMCEQLSGKLCRLQEERDKLFYHEVHVSEPGPYHK